MSRIHFSPSASRSRAVARETERLAALPRDTLTANAAIAARQRRIEYLQTTRLCLRVALECAALLAVLAAFVAVAVM